MEKARQETSESAILDGNLDPVKIVRNGTPELIREALQQCVAATGGNYIVGAGCEIPRDTPLENVLAMRDFAMRGL
jgi:uroporphyrinogen-III decarboxylase